MSQRYRIMLSAETCLHCMANLLQLTLGTCPSGMHAVTTAAAQVPDVRCNSQTASHQLGSGSPAERYRIMLSAETCLHCMANLLQLTLGTCPSGMHAVTTAAAQVPDVRCNSQTASHQLGSGSPAERYRIMLSAETCKLLFVRAQPDLLPNS